MLLADSKLQLRALEPEDLDYLFRWENDTNLWLDGAQNNPFSQFACREFIRNTAGDIYRDGELRLMMEDTEDGSVVGCLDLLHLDVRQGRVELAMYLDPHFRRLGYGTRAVRLAEDYVFRFLRLRLLYVEIRTTNTACMALFRRLGWKQTATLENWVTTLDGYSDVAVWQRYASR